MHRKRLVMKCAALEERTIRDITCTSPRSTMVNRNRIGAGGKDLGTGAVDLEYRESLDWSYGLQNV